MLLHNLYEDNVRFFLVGASFSSDIGRKVASKTRSYRRKPGGQSPTRGYALKLTHKGSVSAQPNRLCYRNAQVIITTSRMYNEITKKT